MTFRRPRICSRSDCGRKAAWYSMVNPYRRRYHCPAHAAALAADEILYPIEVLG